MLRTTGWNKFEDPFAFSGEGRRYQSFIQVNKLGVTVGYRSIGVLGLVVKLQGAVLPWYSSFFPSDRYMIHQTVV